MKNLLIVILFICVASSLSAAQTPLIVAHTEPGLLIRINMVVVAEAYRRINIPIKMVTYPNLRSLIESNAGRTDAEMLRVKLKTEKYPNLIRVPVALYTLEGGVWARTGSKVKINSLRDLNKYHVGLRVGEIWAIKASKNVENLITIPTAELLFRMLLKKRVQVILFTKVFGIGVINTHSFSGLEFLEPTLVYSDLFHYIHKKNIDLLPKLTETFRQMKQDGFMAKTKSEFLKK
ncbi:MAG: transporter substrate-binding domain-containing protein [Deltaproteobacteria bacterium]|nr:transporter substrate-binding domain-containing protein [Deltaproteobacteria bacterium]